MTDRPLTFEGAVAVADMLRPNAAVGLPDDRPPELRALRDAEHPTCPYYRFLYAIAHMFRPITAVEIGTYVGTSAAHLAIGGRNMVTTIDINPDAIEQVCKIRVAGIQPITGDSTTVGERLLRAERKFDVLFVDGNHTFNQAWGEYRMYRQLVRDGGVMLFDDVNLEMDGDEMNVFWEMIPERKVRADWLHATGFGIVEKNDSAYVDSWPTVMRIARPMIESRRKTRR